MNEDKEISVVQTEAEPSVVEAGTEVQTEPTKQTEHEGEQGQGDRTELSGKNEQNSEEKPEATLPEKYEFNCPEGVSIDETAVEEITPILKELKCDAKTAQKLADLHFKQLKAVIDKQNAEFDNTKKEWAKQLKTDSEIGGPDLNNNITYGVRLLNKFGSQDLKTLLVDTGLDRNPAMVKFLVKVGKELGEDSWVDSGRQGAARAETVSDVARLLFDKTV